MHGTYSHHAWHKSHDHTERGYVPPKAALHELSVGEWTESIVLELLEIRELVPPRQFGGIAEHANCIGSVVATKQENLSMPLPVAAELTDCKWATMQHRPWDFVIAPQLQPILAKWTTSRELSLESNIARPGQHSEDRVQRLGSKAERLSQDHKREPAHLEPLDVVQQQR